ncbi:MAG: DUF5654 family protein [Patescibacteria group bacterium]|nr:DUF5654 family protein [Patescibacteria group bacterium]
MNDIDKIKEKIKKETENIRNEAREKILGYLMTALGLVAAFAWNDAVKSLIESLFPFSNSAILAKFIYALFITLIVVIASVYLNKLFNKKE